MPFNNVEAGCYVYGVDWVIPRYSRNRVDVAGDGLVDWQNLDQKQFIETFAV